VTDKDKLLQAKTDYLKAIRVKEEKLIQLKDKLKSIDKQLDELNDKKQGLLF